jgi:pilus assembly protein CpaB
VTAKLRRRRALLLLLLLAAASGGLAASEVRRRVRSVEQQVGPAVPVVVAARDLAVGAQLRPRDLETHEVPERFVPSDAIPSRDEAVGASAAVPLAAGSYLTAGALGAGEGRGREGGGLRRGERAIEVGVTGGEALGESAAPGARVDVLVSTEPHAASGRTFVALEDVELLGLSARSGDAIGAGGAGARAATATATLRVTLRQAVYLAAADNYARELRLLARPPGDRARTGPASVGSGAL